MKGLDGLPDHPARAASIASVTAVEAGDRDGWLALFAPDAVVADPIGPSPLDPTGNRHHGVEAIAAFYDTVIAQVQISFDIRESYACGAECANVGTITSTFPDGSKGVVNGVYTYRVDEQGRLASVRAFWEFEAMQFIPGP